MPRPEQRRGGGSSFSENSVINVFLKSVRCRFRSARRETSESDRTKSESLSWAEPSEHTDSWRPTYSGAVEQTAPITPFCLRAIGGVALSPVIMTALLTNAQKWLSICLAESKQQLRTATLLTVHHGSIVQTLLANVDFAMSWWFIPPNQLVLWPIHLAQIWGSLSLSSRFKPDLGLFRTFGVDLGTSPGCGYRRPSPCVGPVGIEPIEGRLRV